MENLIVIVIVVLIVLGNVYYLYRAKKQGKTCIGCPYAGKCNSAKQQSATEAVKTVSENETVQCSGNCSCCSRHCKNH